MKTKQPKAQKPQTKRKDQPVQARAMWTCTTKTDVFLFKTKQEAEEEAEASWAVNDEVVLNEPVLILPNTKEAYEKMVEQMVSKIIRQDVWDAHAKFNMLNGAICNDARNSARRALESIGITPPQE